MFPDPEILNKNNKISLATNLLIENGSRLATALRRINACRSQTSFHHTTPRAFGRDS